MAAHDASDLRSPPNDRPNDRPRTRPPWEYRDEWADGRITTNRPDLRGSATSINTSMSATRGYVVLAVASVLVLGAMLLMLLKGAPLWALAIPIVIGGFLIGPIVVKLMRIRAYGPTTFDVNPMPGILGGVLQGVLHTPIPADDAPEAGVRVTLSCRQRYRSGGENSTVKRKLLWGDEKRFHGRRSSDGMLDVPIRFDLPADQPPSTPEKQTERIQWILEVSAQQPGLDYKVVMGVPVFPVPECEHPSVPSLDVNEETTDALSHRALSIDQMGSNELRVQCGPALRRTWALGLTSAFLLLGGPLLVASAFMLLRAEGDGWARLMWVGAMNLGITLPLGGLAYEAWTYRSTVTVADGTLAMTRGVLGRRTTIRLACDDVEAVEVQPSDGRNKNQLFVHRTDADADPIRAARMIPDHHEAERIASHIEAACTHSLR